MFVGDIFGGMVETVFDADVSLDSTSAAELFSIQGVAAAVMMFGMTGMFIMESTGTEVLAVLIGGVAAFLSLSMVRKMLQGINNLQADGTMKPSNAIGETGKVYSRIQKNKVGEIQITIDGTIRTVEARAKDPELHIPSGDLIRVVEVIGSTMVVEPLNSEKNGENEHE